MKKKHLIITLSVVIGFTAILGGYFLAKLKNPEIPATSEVPDETLEFTITDADTDENSSISPYTGELLNIEQLTNDTFMCLIDNSRQARPQSGLSQTDFLYEVMTEGGITRFLGLFNSNIVDKIGPVRSARYYFLDLIEEFNLPFAHCGGSYDSLDRISADSSLKSMNEIANTSYFTRDNSRVAPHNLYTKTENMDKLLDIKDFSKDEPRDFIFNDDYWANSDLENCQNIELKLSPYYTTSYSLSENGYIKSMDGKEAIDASNNELLSFDNIVIQLTDITNRENEEYMNIDLVSSGDTYVISSGKMIKATWSKSSTNDTTILKDSSGKEIPFSIGNTIWHIADSSNEIIFD